jgi:SAM-dependent methyltransferase
VASSVLEYVREPGAVLAECARVLRPGGGLLCTVPNLAHPVRWLEWPLRLAAATPLGPPPLAATGRTTPGRSQQYLAYLRTSCQRKRVRWWHAAGREAGFEPAAAPRPRRSLHLLIFTLPGGGTGQPAIPGEL